MKSFLLHLKGFYLKSKNYLVTHKPQLTLVAAPAQKESL